MLWDFYFKICYIYCIKNLAIYKMMQFKKPKNNAKFLWTSHAVDKMIYYGISEGVIRRVIHTPYRMEEGIAENTIAVMQKSGSQKHPKEIWVMYQKVSDKKRIISAWRYPGISPKGSKISIPGEILEELSEKFNISF